MLQSALFLESIATLPRQYITAHNCSPQPLTPSFLLIWVKISKQRIYLSLLMMFDPIYFLADITQISLRYFYLYKLSLQLSILLMI